MNWLLGFGAAIVFVLLPGISLIRRTRGTDPLEWLGLVAAVSVGLNALVLMLMALAGIYTRGMAAGWCGVLIFSSLPVFFLRRYPFQSLPAPASQQAGPQLILTPSRLPYLILLPIFLVQLYKSSFLPFFGWDAIASWNRWARNLALLPDYLQTASPWVAGADSQFFYPLHMALGMSFPYLISADTTTTYPSHALSFAHLLILYAGVVSLARAIGSPAWLAFSGAFVTLPIASFAATGYADLGVTAFSTLAVALYTQSLGRTQGGTGSVFLAGLCTGTSFLFKQSALPLLAALPLLGLLLGGKKALQHRLALGLFYAAGALLTVSPWIFSPHTVLVGGQFRYVTAGIHGGVPHTQILTEGLSRLVSSSTPLSFWMLDWLAIALLFLCCQKAAREQPLCLMLTLASLIQVLVWINTASYDTRGVMPAIPLLSVVFPVGLIGLADRLLTRNRTLALCYGFHVLLVAAFLVGEFAPVLGPPSFSDWRPGANWFRVPPLGSYRQKIGLLFPELGDLEDWKDARPDFRGRVWASPIVLASVNPARLDGGGSHLFDILDGQEHWQGLPGDVLLINQSELQMPAHSGKAVEAWLKTLEEAGRIEAADSFGRMTEYRVISSQSPQD